MRNMVRHKAGTEFELTQEHVALLRAMYVDWCGDEFGAPSIDPKRPYGDSDSVKDIATILTIPPDEDEDDWSEDDYNRMVNLHMETETALQVVLCTGSFTPGVYRRKDRYEDRGWERDASGDLDVDECAGVVKADHIAAALSGDGVHTLGIFQTINDQNQYRAVSVDEFAAWLAARVERYANV